MNRYLLVVAAATSVLAQGIAQTTTRDSLSSTGLQDPNLGSGVAALSQDGRYVAFTSAASTLVTGDTNAASDVFVRDRVTGQTTRISVSSSGVQGNGNSSNPDISPDGRFVVFFSGASNLVAGDTNNTSDVFCHDRLTATTTRVSVGTGGAQITLGGNTGSISADGRYVAFASDDNSVVPNDNCLQSDVFCHDRQTGVTSLVSISNTTGQTFNARTNPKISDDGNWIAFESTATDLVANDNNGVRDIFVWSRATNSIARVSRGTGGIEPNQMCLEASISADGRYTAFTSYSTTFVAGDTNSPDVFVHDRLTGQLTWCSSGLGGAIGNQSSQTPSISADGRFVAFLSSSSNLAIGDTNNVRDVFVRDLALGTTTVASVSTAGVLGNGMSTNCCMSPDGRCVVFDSRATNLVVPDANLSAADVYVRDRGTTASLTFYGTGCPGTGLVVPAITNVGWPLVGNAAFGVGIANGLASSVALVVWNTTSANVPLSGCDVLVAAPINMQPVVFLDAAGTGVAPFPIPNDPLLADLDVFFQALVIDVNGPFLGLGALSNGLAARIGN